MKLIDLQRKWLKEHSASVEQVQEAIGLEQFLNTLQVEKRVWVYEKKPKLKTCIQAGELADEYDQVRKQDARVMVQASSRTTSGQGSGSGGHPGTAGAATTGGLITQQRGTGLERVKCFGCDEFGHAKRNCPNKTSTREVLFCRQEPQSSGALEEAKKVRRCGLVEGQEVLDTILDTRCTQTMVRADLVSQGNLLQEETVTILCAHGDSVCCPLANVGMEVDGQRISVEAAVSERLPVAVLLGRDIPEFDQLLGSVDASSGSMDVQEEAVVVRTRDQAHGEQEAELLTREREPLAEANPTLVEGEQEKGTQLTKVQECQLRQRCQEGGMGAEDPHGHSLKVSAEELQALQDKDMTWFKVKEAVDKHPCSVSTEFFLRGGLPCRKWTSPRRGEMGKVEQRIQPQEHQSIVVYDALLAGHLGKRKTRQTVRQRFYGPTLYEAFEELKGLLDTSPVRRNPEFTQRCSFVVDHRAGTKNGSADALSCVATN